MRRTNEPKRILGLFIGGGQLAYAVINRGDAVPSVVSQGAVPFPLDPSRDEADVVAAKLREILFQNRISVRQCVLALPLGWVVSSRFAIGGMAADVVPEAAALELERLCGAAVSADKVVCLTGRTGEALAVAVEPGIAARLAESCRRAGLKLLRFQPAVTGEAAPTATGTAVDILPLPHQVDALVWRDGEPVVLRQLALSGERSAQRCDECLGTILRNMQLTLAGLSIAGQESVTFRIQGSGQLAEKLANRLRERDDWHLVPAGETQPSAAIQAAILAAGGTARRSDSFAISPPERERRSQWWATRAGRPLLAASVALALGIVVGIAAYALRRVEVKRLEVELAELADSRIEAEDLRSELRLSAPWFSQNPERLAVLLAVAESFPEAGKVWVTDLAIEADGSVSLTGCARDQASLFEVTEKLGKRTRDLRVVRTRQGSKGSDPMTFSVTFTMPPTGGRGGA